MTHTEKYIRLVGVGIKIHPNHQNDITHKFSKFSVLRF